MKLNNRFVALTAILLVSTCTINVKSLNIPFFSDLKHKLSNRSNTYDSKSDSTSKPKRVERVLGKINTEKDDKAERASKPTFVQMFEKFTDPLSKDFPPNFRRNYAIFLLVFTLLVMYAVAGYSRNKKIATGLSLAVEQALEDNFAYVERDPNLLDVKGWSHFEMYASGRTSCRGMLIKLDVSCNENESVQLRKRQCFWHETLITLFQPQNDQVTYDILFESLLMFTNVYDCKEVPDNVRVYLDSNDKSVLQFANYVLHQLNPFINNLEHLYLSDVDSTNTTLTKKPRLQCRFTLTKNYDDFNQLTRLVVHIADCAKNFSLPPKVRELTLKERSELELAYNKLNRSQRDESNEDEPEITSEMMKKYEEKMARKNKAVSNIKIREDIERLKKLRDQGMTTTRNLEESLEFKNPYLLEKIMRVFDIKEYSSNYNKDVYDPSVYEALAKEPLDTKGNQLSRLERVAVNHKVVGSIPTGTAFFKKRFLGGYSNRRFYTLSCYQCGIHNNNCSKQIFSKIKVCSEELSNVCYILGDAHVINRSDKIYQFSGNRISRKLEAEKKQIAK
ncbi:uncharacterized protein TOT_040000248 [Theileria orientalis strain Shintoku]|uniref:Uncharacterized protein n=1 Tax=Theileria orientalis strain Shintoku TaxID=869250 RepID=J4C939_THEOR|nr:uncharacterized protein TOT_040000248 [Theileria orientalis strain Shintoku]BAM41868.1 uncharacterized protein TOT_040000248 [Theileria orientalis strain Shintoku]|eukprot:XP_009692169.1 uncharacterized protein TOT_040000248 [Theileria orientalis strain Shintoku]